MSVGFSVLIAGYAIGATPFAWLVARRFGHVDIRRTGSGNVGAANVWRSTRPLMGAVVALLDVAKGAGAVLLAARAGADEGLAAAAGVCAAVGHVAPIWLKFRGGKGVATSAGVMSIVAPRALAVGLAVFALTAWRTRYVSLASMAASVATAVAAIVGRDSRAAAGAALVLCALILVRHRANVERLRAGTERRDLVFAVQTIAILGAGSWGTSLAVHLARTGHAVRLWGRDPELMAQLQADHENPVYLPGIRVEPPIQPTASLAAALAGSTLVVVAIPSHGLRPVLHQAVSHLATPIPIVSTRRRASSTEPGSGCPK